MAGEVTREELNALIKGINGDFEDIKVSLRDLNSTMNRRFDTLDAKMETERKEGLESHRRIHKRVDGVSDSLAVEMAGVGREFTAVRVDTTRELSDFKKKHMDKNTAAIIVVLSSASVGLLIAFLSRL